MAVKSPSCISSRLNPNAPHFVPSYFESVEDFSPEWWNLVKTCPAFRDFWIRERWEVFNMTDALASCEEIEEFSEFDEDFGEELASPEYGKEEKPLETLKEQDVNTPPKSPRVVKVMMDLVPRNVVETVPRQARQKILRVPPKLTAAQMRKNSMAVRIQQPR